MVVAGPSWDMFENRKNLSEGRQTAKLSGQGDLGGCEGFGGAPPDEIKASDDRKMHSSEHASRRGGRRQEGEAP